MDTSLCHLNQTAMANCQRQISIRQLQDQPEHQELLTSIQIKSSEQANLKGCEADCLCNMIPTVPPRLDVEDICQVLGRDILRSSLLEDIELYLECDEDSVYAVPINKPNADSKLPPTDAVSLCFPSLSDNTDPTGRYKCPYCSRTFTRRNLVMDHRVRVHEDKNLFPCSFCHYQGKSSRHLKRHFERAHKINSSKLRKSHLSDILRAVQMAPPLADTDPMKGALNFLEHEPISDSSEVPFDVGAINSHQDITQVIGDGKEVIIEPKEGIIQEIPIPGTDCYVVTEIVESSSPPSAGLPFDNAEIVVVNAVHPDTVQRNAVQSDAVMSDAVQPNAILSDIMSVAVHPHTVHLDAVLSDAVMSDVVHLDSVQPDVLSDTVRPYAVRSDGVMSDDVNLDAVPSDGIMPNAVQPDTVQQNTGSGTKRTHPVHCELCAYACKTTRLLKKHHEALHNQDREVHCCDKCGCTFKQKRSLDIHMKVHSGQFDFKCDVCSKRFVSRDHLRLHGRTHIATRQFACSLCGKAFRTRGDLAQHTRTVHAPALIRCPEDGCERVFTRRHLAAAHYKVHTGTFRCLQATCGRTFRDAHNLRAHHKTHHTHKD